METKERLQRYMTSMAMLTAQHSLNKLKHPSPLFYPTVLKITATLIIELKNIGVVKPVIWLEKALTDRKDQILLDLENTFRYDALFQAIIEIKDLFKALQTDNNAEVKSKLKGLGFNLGD